MDQTQILETLKSNFLFNFRTGNVMVDTFVTGLIIMLSTYLLNLSNNLFSFDWSSLPLDFAALEAPNLDTSVVFDSTVARVRPHCAGFCAGRCVAGCLCEVDSGVRRVRRYVDQPHCPAAATGPQSRLVISG